jgi:hypothetical protein
VVVLHGLWDGLPQLIDALTGSGLDVFVGQGSVAVAGLVILGVRWREAVHRQLAAPSEPALAAATSK